MFTSVGWRNSLCRLHARPDYDEVLSFLSHLNIEELQLLLSEDKNCDDIIKELKQLKEMEETKEMLTASNRSLAEFNLTRKPELTRGKQRLQELSERGERIYKAVEAKFEELLKQDKTQETLNRLQVAMTEVEEESETLVTKFMDGKVEVEEFLQQFLPRRKLMYLRKIKAEKMEEMTKKRQKLLMPSFRVQPPAEVPNGARKEFQIPPNSEVPYPTADNIIMPMPNTPNV